MKKSKLLMVMLTVMLGVVLLCFTASAYSGNCGDNVNWTLDTDTGVLTISGTGQMKDFVDENGDRDKAPWYDVRNEIETVIIEEGVTSIGQVAFVSCENMKNIVVPNSVTSIGAGAFGNCYNLKSIDIPECVETIHRETFFYCKNLESVTLPDSIKTIETFAFYFCENLKNIILPNNDVNIYPHAFATCYGIESITVPANVRYIDKDAFVACINLNTFIVDENNETYSSQDGVLFNKDKTELLIYPSSKKDITYKIPETVEKICESGITNYYMEKLYIPSSVESICESGVRCPVLSEAYFYGDSITINENQQICYSSVNYDKFIKYREEYLSIFPDPYLTDDEETIARFEELTAEINLDEAVPFGTIYGYSGSTAEVYADKYGINFVPFVTESTDEETDINASFKPDTFPSGTVILIDKKGQNADGTFNGKYEYYESYDISFVDENNKEVQPNGKVTVRIPVPHKFNPEKTVVYYVAPDGTATKLESWHEGKYIVFETDHFSEYVIVDESSEIIATPEPDEPEVPDEPQKPAEKKNLFEQLIDFLTKLFNFIKNLFA